MNPESVTPETKAEHRLQSRKLWITVGYALLCSALGVTGEVPWKELLFSPVGGLGAICMAYLGVQAGIDAVGRWRGGW